MGTTSNINSTVTTPSNSAGAIEAMGRAVAAEESSCDGEREQRESKGRAEGEQGEQI